MSTYVYLRCEDHTPPLVSDDESGQHLYDLPQIRADIANRDVIVAAWRSDLISEEQFRRATARFLVAHPFCRLSIQDEYGHEHSATEEAVS